MTDIKELGVMLDLETLGVADDALITQIGAVIFDLKTGETFQTFNQTLNFEETDSDFPLFTEDIKRFVQKDVVTQVEEKESFVRWLINHRYNRMCSRLNIEVGTLNFWLCPENVDVLINHLSRKDGLDEYSLMKAFHDFLVNAENYLGVDLKIWGNGISFDVVKIKRKLEKKDLSYPIRFYNERDVRTILELASLKTGKTIYEIKDMVPENNRPHDALEDCIFQINTCKKCYDLLMK